MHDCFHDNNQCHCIESDKQDLTLKAEKAQYHN